MAGKQDRCPGCGQLIKIPASDNGSGGGAAAESKQDEAYFNALQFLNEQQNAPPAKPGHAKIARCQACCRLIPEGAAVCPFCGRMAPLAPIQTKEESAHAASAEPGVFLRSCLEAMTHPKVHFRSVFLAAMSLMLWYAVGRLWFHYFPDMHPSRQWQKWLIASVAAPLALLTAGCCLQAMLDHIRRAATETPEPLVERSELLNIVFAGLLAIPMAVVYMLPIVTVPLLPLGLLALGMTRDARAFNVRWSARAAVACGEEFAYLWLLLILSAGALALLFTLVVWLASWIGAGIASVVGGTEGNILAEMVHLMGAALAGILACFLACGPIRCVGLLARHHPIILAWLPRQASRSATGIAIAAGAIVLAVLLVVSI
jgi:hypothetical protein